jgi:hypothetical protein
MARKPTVGRRAGKARAFYVTEETDANIAHVVAKTNKSASELFRQFFDTYAAKGYPSGFAKIAPKGNGNGTRK